MLALFAPAPYQSPPTTTENSSTTTNNDKNNSEAKNLDPRIHLTNTCLHTPSPSSSPPSTPNVHRFSSLPLPLPQSQHPSYQPSPHTQIQTQIYNATSTLFLSAAQTQTLHFQTLPNSFEIFGLDWLLDSHGQVWLLEVNAFPDFRQSGDVEEVGRGVVRGLWEGVVREGVVPFFEGMGEGGRGQGGKDRGNSWDRGEGKGGERREEEEEGMVKVLDVDLGRR